MKDFLRHNRAFAAVALVVIVLLSTTLSITLRISYRQGKVESAYSGKGATVETNVKRLLVAAQGLNSLADAVGVPDVSLSSAVVSLGGKADKAVGQGKAVEDVILSAAGAFPQIINAAGTSDAQKNSARLYFKDIKTAFDALSASVDYAKRANAYNASISQAAALFGRRDAAVDYSELSGRYDEIYTKLLASSKPEAPQGNEVITGLWKRFVSWFNAIRDALPFVGFLATLVSCAILVLIVIVGFKILAKIVDVFFSHGNVYASPQVPGKRGRIAPRAGTKSLPFWSDFHTLY